LDQPGEENLSQAGNRTDAKFKGCCRDRQPHIKRNVPRNAWGGKKRKDERKFSVKRRAPTSRQATSKKPAGGRN